MSDAARSQIPAGIRLKDLSNTWRVMAAISIVALAAFPLASGNRFFLYVGSMVAIMGSFALGMNLMLRLGLISIAHVAFGGLGAYCSALLTLRLGFGAFPALLVSGLAVGLLALALGTIFLRIKGVYFVLLTFAFTQVVNLMFQHWTDLFGGNNGLHGIPRFDVFGYRLTTPTQLYIGALVLFGVTTAIVALLYRSYVGKMIASLNEDEDLCRSLGVNPMSWYLLVFSLSSALAGIVGSYYAHFIGFLSPDAFGFRAVVDLLLINVVGGILSVFGPIIGAIILVPLPELLRGAKQYQMLVFGLTLIGFMLFFRTGITGMLFRKR